MIKKLAAGAGALGTVLFTLSFTINGALRPDYNPSQRYISELAIGPLGWIQILSFLVLGICIILFSLGVKAAFPTGKASRAAPVLFMIIGICYILSGVFVTDPYAMFDNQQTLHGIIHGIVGAVVFSLSAAAFFVLWRRFRVDTAWKSLSVYSLVSGIAMVVLIVLMKVGQLKAGFFHEYAGVVQRCCLMLSYMLVFLISVRMSKQG